MSCHRRPSNRPPSVRPGLVAAVLALEGCAQLPLLGKAPERPRPASAAAKDSEAPPPLPFALTTAEDYVVRVVVDDVTCSGALIETDQVLTAHHCVSGRGPNGEMLPDDVAPDAVRVELGGDDLPWGEVSVKAIVAPSCGYAAGNGDVAVLVLEEPLIGVATRAPRIDRAPALRESIQPIGFGRCALSNNGIHRRVRPAATIDRLYESRFRGDASICPGDSGGPVVSEQGEIVGVISSAVMDGSEATVGRAEFTRLDHFRALFARATAVAAGTSLAELPPVDCGPAAP